MAKPTSQYVVETATTAVDVTGRQRHLQPGGVVPDNLPAATVARLIEGQYITESRSLPEGEPSTDWTSKQLDAYALERSIDLAGAKSKPEKVAAIQAAPPE